MRILVLGAGATGGYFGGRVAEAGADVTFLVRARRAKQLEDGLVIASPAGNARLKVKTVAAEALAPGYDLAILSCKAYDIASAIEAIRPAMGGGCAVLPLLNGLRQLDALDAAFGMANVLGGSCQIGATLTPDGTVQHTGQFATLLYGARLPAQSERIAAIARAFKGAKFEHRASPNILQEMWDKFVLITTIAGMTTLMRAPVGDIARSRDGAGFMIATLDECAAVAAAAGFGPEAGTLAGLRDWLTSKESTFSSSMFRDTERKNAIEADHIVGDMLARAEAAHIAAPMLRLIYAHLQTYEIRRQREGG